MAVKKQHKMKTVAATAAVCIILAGGAGTAYAADVGGVQRTIQLWIDGDKMNATMELKTDGDVTAYNDDGKSTYYNIKLDDKDGNTTEINGAGIVEEDGKKRSLTQDEIVDQANQPEVDYKDDGSVWLYYKDQKRDITDRFKDGICYVKLKDGKNSLYVTIKYKDGYAMSDSKYLSPEEVK